ncbi:hypothetical protein RclHR1_03140010 [Rhizophagus clarus]|uniref:Protein kinase domain-containing protein n=1 Tax=Rhizophagus clarus TaxID=94130 RepID=A0A2Z6RNA8_9GLOM|nr:hypothetical protein RclHR1_03140010 [Rhizophagus clarus]
MRKTLTNFDDPPTAGSETDTAICIVQTAAEIIKTLEPHFEIAIIIASTITEICDKAKANKKICRVLADRVDLALISINYLKRHMDKSVEKFREKSYFESFMHFIEVLENIKNFAEEVSEIKGFKKFFVANVVNQQLNNIRDDFDYCYKSLQLAFTIDGFVNRENENEEIISDLNQLKYDIKQNFHVTEQKLSIIAAKIEMLEKNSSVLNKSKPPEIEQKHLIYPEVPIVRNSVVLRKYKNLDVACKPTKYSPEVDTPQSKEAGATLMIWKDLSECPYIIKFMGISKLHNSDIYTENVIVLEWAEFGNLKSLYESENLNWKLKLNMVRDVFRGLCVLHHDVRCENILVAEEYKCKITNFTLSHKTQYVTSKVHSVENTKQIMSWMAPEKLKSYQRSNQSTKIEPYTYACEMFSFGMFLWELSFNRVPYKDMEYNEIIEHVMSGKREKLDFVDCPRDIRDGFTEIITSAWQHESCKRPTTQKISKILESLYKSGNVDNHVRDLLPLSKGIEHHNTKAMETKSEQDYKICWECFNAHANMGNKTAMYWKGFYLWNGLVEKNQIEAKRLFKIAADAGFVEAQLEYAFANLENLDLPPDTKEFWKYLEMAAKNGNPKALYHIGITYYEGRMGTRQDKEKGIEYLKLSALQNYYKAIDKLEKYNIIL